MRSVTFAVEMISHVRQIKLRGEENRTVTLPSFTEIFGTHLLQKEGTEQA